MASSLRVFIALPIPSTVAAFLERIQGRMRSADASIRWVPAANIHLTLKFLGEIDPSSVPGIAARMDAAARSTPPFFLSAQGVGVFPNLRQARIVWVGLTGDLDRLAMLHRTLEAELERLSFQRESRVFRAHLTIGRMRRRLDPKALGDLQAPLKTTASDPFRADRISLFRSVLKPSGAEYTRLHTAPLAIPTPSVDG
jgi:RNA 2',3'-cyclic 3'-phosphodiesterase